MADLDVDSSYGESFYGFDGGVNDLSVNLGPESDWLIDWLHQSFTAPQHQKGHTVPKQVSPPDDNDDITESTRKKSYGSTVWEQHCPRIALCESIRFQAKSEQNVRQDLIPRVRHG